VTEEEALQILQLGARTGEPDEIRRAYLRRVKVVKPEVDPAGFARLREAYEFLSRPVLVVKAAGPAAPAPDRPGPPPAEPNPFDAYRERLVNRPYHEQLAIAREAVAALPDSTEARWHLLSFFTDPYSLEAVRVLTEGAARRPDEFLDELLWRYPDRVTPAMLQAAAAGAGPARLLLVADAHAEQGRAAEALRIYRAALDAAGDLEGPLALALAVRPVFALHARHDLGAAGEAWVLLKAHVGTSAFDATRATPETAVVYTVADELARLGPELPAELRRVAARAAKSHDFESAAYEARIVSRQLRPADLRRARKLLDADAPSTRQLLALHLSDEELRPRGMPSLRPAVGLPIVAVLYFVGRLVFHLIEPETTRAPIEAISAPAVSAASAAALLEEACEPLPAPAMCSDLRRIAGDLQHEEATCESLRMRLGLVLVSSLDKQPAAIRKALAQVSAALDQRCPP
jgi:hypothetical protein